MSKTDIWIIVAIIGLVVVENYPYQTKNNIGGIVYVEECTGKIFGTECTSWIEKQSRSRQIIRRKSNNAIEKESNPEVRACMKRGNNWKKCRAGIYAPY